MFITAYALCCAIVAAIEINASRRAQDVLANSGITNSLPIDWTTVVIVALGPLSLLAMFGNWIESLPLTPSQGKDDTV